MLTFEQREAIRHRVEMGLGVEDSVVLALCDDADGCAELTGLVQNLVFALNRCIGGRPSLRSGRLAGEVARRLSALKMYLNEQRWEP